jgi:glycosyltransferase involved in cell wall biosynthesis
VIAYNAGGALDYVVPGKTGEFFKPQTKDSLTAALEKFDPKKFDRATIEKSAVLFSSKQFQEKIRAFILKSAK